MNVDLSALKRAVAAMNPDVEVDFEVASQDDDFERVGAKLNHGVVLGEDIELKDIDGSEGILKYKGHQVMLYIPDQGSDILEVLDDGEKGRRIHVAECKTLDDMRNKGRFERYDVISRMDGSFPVFGSSSYSGQIIKDEAELCVCKNCLKVLNYKRYDDSPYGDKHRIFKDFNFEKFFETYSSYFKSLPETSNSGYVGASYTKDWAEISNNYRVQQGYQCECCDVSLKADKRLLHVHHKDGVRNNNKLENLQALCADCHKKQPHHGHLHVSRRDTLIINYLRRKQKKFDAFDYNRLSEFGDTALEGLVSKCRRYSVPVPELGITVVCGTKSVPIDLAWPRKNVAVLINTEDKTYLESEGWEVWPAGKAVTSFSDFQWAVR